MHAKPCAVCMQVQSQLSALQPSLEEEEPSKKQQQQQQAEAAEEEEEGEKGGGGWMPKRASRHFHQQLFTKVLANLQVRACVRVRVYKAPSSFCVSVHASTSRCMMMMDEYRFA